MLTEERGKQRRTMKSDLENRWKDSISRPVDLFIPDLPRLPKSRSRSIDGICFDLWGGDSLDSYLGYQPDVSWYGSKRLCSESWKIIASIILLFPPFFFFLASSRCALSFVIRIRLFDIWRYAIDEISISRKTTRTLIHRNGIKIKRRGFTDIWKEICSRFHEKWTRYIWMSREGYEPVTINVSDVKEDEGSSHGKGKRRSWRIFRFDRMKRETKREWIRRDRSMEIWIKFVRYDLPVHPRLLSALYSSGRVKRSIFDENLLSLKRWLRLRNALYTNEKLTTVRTTDTSSGRMRRQMEIFSF